MKYLLPALLYALCISVTNAHSQDAMHAKYLRPDIHVSLGTEKMFLNNNNINDWSRLNTGDGRKYGTGTQEFVLNIGLIDRRKFTYDVTWSGGWGSHVFTSYFDLAAGKMLLYKRFFNISLDAEAGIFNYDLLHVDSIRDYVRTADQSGKNMSLRYSDYGLGLNLKTDFYKLLERADDEEKLYVGICLRFLYLADAAQWRYGYTAHTGKSSAFHANEIGNIPFPDHFACSAGIYIGFSEKRYPHHG